MFTGKSSSPSIYLNTKYKSVCETSCTPLPHRKLQIKNQLVSVWVLDSDPTHLDFDTFLTSH